MRISDWSSDVCSSDLAYPDITLDLVVEDRLVDVVKAGFDAGVRLGEKLEKDMVAVKLGRELEMVAVAAPAYLERFGIPGSPRSEEHTSELQSLMRISYAVFCLKKKNNTTIHIYN